MNKEIGKTEKVNGFVGIVGVDKSVDRQVFIAMIARNADRLGTQVSSDGKTVLDRIYEGLPFIVGKMAQNGLLTPDEIRSSPACSDIWRRECERVENERKAIEDERAKARAAAEKARQKAESALALVDGDGDGDADPGDTGDGDADPGDTGDGDADPGDTGDGE